MKTILETKPYKNIIQKINQQRNHLEKADDRWLREKARFLREQKRFSSSLDEMLIEVFALASEASRRELNLRPFDVQLAAALAIHQGNIAQMQTGEGKTLAAVLPVYLNALSGKGVHVFTFNDYLARRDAEWMGPIYKFLGLSVEYIQEGMTLEERKKAYAADITYLTAREAGFDFLKDQLCTHKKNLAQRPFNFVVIDEADSILIDEARVPMVIARNSSIEHYNPYQLAKIVSGLKNNTHYYFDEYSMDVNYTDEGIGFMEKELNCSDLHSEENNHVLAAANLALQAEFLLKRDIDYIIRQGKIELVDAFTGRIADRRRWPYGLQTAIEAKEGLEIQPGGSILGSISLQHFVQLYPKIAGMTATAKTSEEECMEFYNLNVIDIPSNKACIRHDLPDQIFTHKEAKCHAIMEEIKRYHHMGRPVLVGTASVKESENLADQLKESGIHCNVLNARNDELEASIIAEAGDLGAVTISTNMAGRGTDIRLGGAFQENREKVVALGGLYVIGTNRHESRRIDFQLRGRAGRQGDPGTSRFFISLEDDLMVRYNIKELIPKKYFPKKQSHCVDSPVIGREIARIQRIIEGENFEIRKTLYNYSFIIEAQRKLFQGKRSNLLHEQEYLNLLELHPESRERYDLLSQSIDSEILYETIKQIALYHIDKVWADHLEYMSQIKEGIHLMRFAGNDPLMEYQKTAITQFKQANESLEKLILETFQRVEITADGIDFKKEGMERPTSTWTYLINDMPYMMPLFQVLISNNAFAFGAALFILQNLLLLPIFLLWRLVRKIVKKNKIDNR